MSTVASVSKEVANQAAAALGQTVTLRSVFGKQQGKFTQTPSKDGITGALRGVKVMTDEMKRHTLRVVDETTSRDLTDGMVFNLVPGPNGEDTVDIIDWRWIKETEEVCMTQEEAQMSKNALFYVEDVNRDAEERVQRRKDKWKAGQIVNTASPFELRQLARVMGQKTDRWTELAVFDWMSEQAETIFSSLIAKYEDENMKTRLFFYQLADNGILKERDGVWMYGGHILGKGDLQAIAWLDDHRNQEMVRHLYLEANGMLPANAPKYSAVEEVSASVEREELKEEREQIAAMRKNLEDMMEMIKARTIEEPVAQDTNPFPPTTRLSNAASFSGGPNDDNVNPTVTDANSPANQLQASVNPTGANPYDAPAKGPGGRFVKKTDETK